MLKVKMTVFGRVQGVGFRYTVLSCAKSLRIKGRVWNNNDGSVGILAQSDDSQALSAFEGEVRKGFSHSPWIKVTYVDVTTDNSPDYKDFQVSYG